MTALLLDAAPRALEVLRHLAQLALQLRVGTESSDRCDEADALRGATLRDRPVADRREQLLAELPVLCERPRQFGCAHCAVLDSLSLCASEHLVSFPSFR